MTPELRLALVLVLSTALACDRGMPPADALVERLIAEDPQVLLPREELFTDEPVFHWTFASAADLEDWQTHGLGEARLDRGQWLLPAADDDPWLERRLGLDASRVHEVEVKLAGLLEGQATLYWAGPGEPFSDDRSLTVEPPKPRRKGQLTLTFDLAEHREWRGAVERLRFDPTDNARDTVRLRSIRGLRRVADPERLAEVLGRGWKIDLAADARNALLAVPGVPVEREIEVGRDQRLVLSYGLEANVDQAVEFRVEARAKEQGAAEVLFRETLDPAAGAAGQWYEATVDLGAHAGRRLHLKLETRALRLLDLGRGFAVWGNPEILGPRVGEPPPNVILISLDTLRADRLSGYGHHRKTSPNLDRWAAESAVLFENAVVQAPWTLPSHASMFTGLEALRHDVNHYREAPASLELLAETLRREGYATAAITGGGYLRPRFGFAQGFDVFRYWPQILAERELADGTQRLLSWLDENRARQFFLFFHTYEVHFPHRRRQPWFDQFQGDPRPVAEAGEAVRGKINMRARPQKPGDLLWQHDYFTVKLPSGVEVEHLNQAEQALARTMYDSAIAYVDAQLEQVFERLEALGLSERTLIVVTSDHGEALGEEEDRAGHNYLEDYNVMVPLIIGFPDGHGAGQRISQQVRSIDLVPTILAAVDVPPTRPTDGVSLLPLIDGDASAVPAAAWTYASSANKGVGLRYGNRFKYLFNNTAWARLAGAEALYDLRRDPAEAQDLAASHPSTADFRGQAEGAVEAYHEGLRMRIQNGGSGVLAGQLGGGWVGVNRIKSTDQACRCLRWESGRVATFSLSAGQEVTLLFESVHGDRVGLQGRLERPGSPAARFDESFNVHELEEPAGLAYSAAGWRRVPPGAEPEAVGFTIWNVGGRWAERVEKPADAKLQSQLEALGYVN